MNQRGNQDNSAQFGVYSPNSSESPSKYEISPIRDQDQQYVKNFKQRSKAQVTKSKNKLKKSYKETMTTNQKEFLNKPLGGMVARHLEKKSLSSQNGSIDQEINSSLG